MSHSLPGAGGGYVWPNLTIFSEGEQVTVQVRPTSGESWEPVRYLEHHDCFLSAAGFERAVDTFVDTVLARLAACKISESELHRLWLEVGEERHDPIAASIRRLEALLGYDPAKAPDSLIDELRTEAAAEGQTAVDEVAAGFADEATVVLKQLDRGLANHGTSLDGTSVVTLGRHRDDWRPSGKPWEPGEKAAQKAREIWDLNGQPVSNGALAQLVGADASLLEEHGPPEVPIPAGRWSTPDRKTWSVVLRSRWEVGRRFELCRLIADALVAPRHERLLPATNAKTTRQKFQRAFAQEFLCPYDELQARLQLKPGDPPPEDEEIEEAARYFEVSPRLIQSKLANKGYLSRF
jgi:hypothetical protein